jgi:hypothetical protein
METQGCAHHRWRRSGAAGFCWRRWTAWSLEAVSPHGDVGPPVHPRRRAGALWMCLDVANRAVVATSAGSAKVRQIDNGRWFSTPAHERTDDSVPVAAHRREACGCTRLDLVKLTTAVASPVSVPAQRNATTRRRWMAAWSTAACDIGEVRGGGGSNRARACGRGGLSLYRCGR